MGASFDSDVDPQIEHAKTRIGSTLKDKWRIDALLGVGGMAVVYTATHRNSSRVAVKMLHAELSRNANIKGRFLREGYVANSVGHRGCVTVFDDDVADDGAVFLVMELLDGETLEARRERLGGALDPGETLWITDQLLDVLAAAHAKGIIHRDIKPENIFLTGDGVVKVLDFGIAHVRQLSTSSTATRTGTTMGTPAFMPPEQARGRWENVDAQSDLWAVGATMFTLLTGRMVHEAATANEQMLAAMTANAPSLAGYGTFDANLSYLVDRSLAFDKADRWQDAPSMQRAVRAAYAAIFRRPIASMARPVTSPSLPVATTGLFAPAPAADEGRPASAPRPAEARALGLTAGPVSTGKTGVPFDPARRNSHAGRWVASGISAAVIAAAVMLALWGRTTNRAQPATDSGIVQTLALAAPTASSSTDTPLASDAAIDSLPIPVAASAAPPPAPDAGIAKKPPTPPLSPPSAKPPPPRANPMDKRR